MNYKIKKEDLEKIVLFIGESTPTKIGIPLMNLINKSISECTCELPSTESKGEEK